MIISEKETIKRLKKIAKAIDKGSLSIFGGTKNWFNYYLNISKLVWARNLVDGFHVFIQFDGRHLGTIEIDNNLNKMQIVYHFEGEDKRILI